MAHVRATIPASPNAPIDMRRMHATKAAPARGEEFRDDLRAIAEHDTVTDLSSPLIAARCNRTTGRLTNWLGRALLFPHHVNHPLEHHLYPAVPHYHLPALHRLLRSKGALAGAEVREIGETMRIVFAPRST